ncbi:DUF4872 domain-containing protein [Streptosporangiaceae bacterium NEAU-GS5]|nr:DUF4872 domain-containing protein [Streptosporangiaceae bacterium NEAU-GS5]
MTILPGYLMTGGGDHHDSALLTHVLRHAGVVAPHTGQPYGEAMLAGLGGGIGFMYAIFEFPGVTTTTIVAQHHPEPFIPAALSRAAVPYDTRTTGSPAIAERSLRTALAAGRSAIIRVDPHLLPWRPELPPGGAYEVGVAGLDGATDDLSDTAYVDDRCTRPNAVALGTLLAAWTAYKKGKHHLVSVTGRPDDVDLPKALRDAIATTAAHLTGPVLGHAFDINYGLSGMRRLADQLADDKGKQGWAARFADPAKLFSALTRLNACLEVQLAAPGAMRPLYAAFLDEAAPLVHRRLGEAAALYRAAGSEWSAIASAALAGRPALVRYDELARRLRALQRSDGAMAADELARLAQEMGGSLDDYLADPLGEGERRALFDTLAAHAHRALEKEEAAVFILKDVTGE